MIVVGFLLAWSEWSGWQPCSASCGGGLTSRYRVGTWEDRYHHISIPHVEKKTCNEHTCDGKYHIERKVRKCRFWVIMFKNVWNFLLNSDISTLPHKKITYPISINTHLSVPGEIHFFLCPSWRIVLPVTHVDELSYSTINFLVDFWSEFLRSDWFCFSATTPDDIIDDIF